jgi:hypothetical protein
MSKNANWTQRVLLIALCASISALLIGATVWRFSGREQRNREDEAIAEIEAQGGIVDGKQEFGFFGRLRVWHVTLPRRPAPPTIEFIKMFPHLKSVTIKGEQLSDDDEVRLGKALGVRIVSFVPVQPER